MSAEQPAEEQGGDPTVEQAYATEEQRVSFEEGQDSTALPNGVTATDGPYTKIKEV